MSFAWWLPALFTFTAWAGLTVLFHRAFRSERTLERIPPAADHLLAPLTIVVPALNEQDKVESAMRSLLALDYPDFTIIAVDDRSTDSTGRILDGLAAETGRLTVIHVTKLPPGWLGKNHALSTGASRTKTPWILFTDA